MTLSSPASDLATDPAAPWLAQAVIETGAPLSEQVYRLLRATIITGVLEPGAALQEPVITAQLGISRTPVREALLRLKDDGLVQIRRQAGTCVAPIDANRVEEGIIVRESLEPRIAQLAAARIDARTLEVLTHQTERMARAAARQDSRTFIEADDLFHQTLIDASGHQHIARIIQQINAQLDRIRYLSVSEPIRAQTAVDEHHQLIAALSAGDGATCSALLQHHLEGSWVLIRRYLQALAPQPRPDIHPAPR